MRITKGSWMGGNTWKRLFVAPNTVYRRRLSEMLRNSVISRLLLSESSCCDNAITVELRKHR